MDSRSPFRVVIIFDISKVVSQKVSLLRMSLIEQHLKYNLASGHFWMCHCQLQCPLLSCWSCLQRPSTEGVDTVIQAPNVFAGNNLSEPPILRVPDLDEVAVEENKVRAVQSAGLSLAHELHDDGARDVPVLIHVDRAFLIAEKEFGVGETEHPQWFLILYPRCDGSDRGVFKIRNAHGQFLVQRHQFKPLCGRNGNVGVEEVNAKTFRWDVEFVEFTEEFCGAARSPTKQA